MHILATAGAAEGDVCDGGVECFAADGAVAGDGFAATLETLFEDGGRGAEEVFVDTEGTVDVAGLDLDESAETGER